MSNRKFQLGDDIETTRHFHIMANDGWSTGPSVPIGTKGVVTNVWSLGCPYPYTVELDLKGNPRVLVDEQEIAKIRK